MELARRMPEVRFLWFRVDRPTLLPREINDALDAAPDNVMFLAMRTGNSCGRPTAAQMCLPFSAMRRPRESWS